MSVYCKSYYTYQEQLDLLKSRGLIITNDQLALEYLNRLGYYRLSGYWYPFRKLAYINEKPKREKSFVSGAKFQSVVDLYIFDKKLRLLILDAIERIEVNFRVEIAYLLGKKDKFAYTKESLLHGNFTKKVNSKTGYTDYQKWIKKHDILIHRSREEFVAHYKEKYGLPLPIWVAIELWDFGLLSVFYQGMKVEDKQNISLMYGIPNWKVMQSWIKCLNYIRNVAAHHCRLWNRNLIEQPKIAKKGEITNLDHCIGDTHATSRVYIVLCILIHFIEYVCPRSSFKSRVVDLINDFPNVEHVNINNMGFPINWRQSEIWM